VNPNAEAAIGGMVDRGIQIVQNGTVLRPSAPYHLGMTVKELTLQQLLSVYCSTCGAAPGEQCVLHYGGVRFAPHPTRKFDRIRNERLSGSIAIGTRGNRQAQNGSAIEKECT
jgi:hypothetical protein